MKLYELSFQDVKNLSFDEKIKMVSDTIKGKESVGHNFMINILKTLDISEKSNIIINRTFVFLLQGAIFEYAKYYSSVPKIVIYQDYAIVGDSDYCIEVYQDSITIPDYYMPPKGGIEIGYTYLRFIDESTIFMSK